MSASTGAGSDAPLPPVRTLDHPDVIRRLTVIDVIPTGEVWARADDRFALGYGIGVEEEGVGVVFR